jgi:hypothetical protein
MSTDQKPNVGVPGSSSLTTLLSEIPSFIFNPTQEPTIETTFFDGFLSEGDLVLWIGREKHRKSNIILQFAIAAAAGRDFLFMPFRAPRPLKVVYLDYESKTGSLKMRYEAICTAMGLTEGERTAVQENLEILEIRRLRKTGQTFPRFPVKGEVVPAAFWRSLAKQHKADIYIIDPLRCSWVGQENDSQIEGFLTALRENFQGAAVIVAHHMRKQGGEKEYRFKLAENMRDWSDGARGSGAIKAHADGIVCQERVEENDEETIYFGAYMKDGADIGPIPLQETDGESFYFKVVREIPAVCRSSYGILRRNAAKLTSRADAVRTLIENKVTRATAYRHIRELTQVGLLTEDGTGCLKIHEPETGYTRGALKAAGPVKR